MLFCSETFLVRPIFKPSDDVNEDRRVPNRLCFLFTVIEAARGQQEDNAKVPKYSETTLYIQGCVVGC